MKCTCGCGREATLLCTFSSPEGGATDEPCCASVADYLFQCCADFGLPFTQRDVAAETKETGE